MHRVQKYSWVVLLFSFGVLAAQPLTAETTPSAAQPTPSVQVLPGVGDMMSQEQQKAASKEIQERVGSAGSFKEQPDENAWEFYQEKDGRKVKATLNRDENGRIRQLNLFLGWRHGARILGYFYDGQGRLMQASVAELLEGKLFGKIRSQVIFIDENGNIIAVRYSGKFKDEFGQINEGQIVLRKPIPLVDGSALELVLDPKKIQLGDLLDSIVDKPGERPQRSPYVGFSIGAPCLFNVLAGMDLVGPLGFDLEGSYLSSTDNDIHAEVTCLFPNHKDGGVGNAGFGLAALCGFGNGASTASTDRSYSGFGFFIYPDNTSRMELDCVQDGFGQFPYNGWRLFYRSELLHFFD